MDRDEQDEMKNLTIFKDFATFSINILIKNNLQTKYI